MRGMLKQGLRMLVAVIVCVTVTAPLLADSKAETLQPAGDQTPAAKSEAELRKELEAEYREAMEARVAQEMANYDASLRSLWISNSAVWAVLLLFVVLQALSARKRERELERLRNQ